MTMTTTTHTVGSDFTVNYDKPHDWLSTITSTLRVADGTATTVASTVYTGDEVLGSTSVSQYHDGKTAIVAMIGDASGLSMHVMEDGSLGISAAGALGSMTVFLPFSLEQFAAAVAETQARHASE